MAKIKMLESIPGALNGGLNVKLFKKDLVYDREDMEGIDQIFLDNGYAEEHVTPDEVLRHEKGLSGAPTNKREKGPESNKRSSLFENLKNKLSKEDPDNEDPDNGDDLFTYEELDGAKAGDMRKLAEENNIDLSDFPKNTSGDKLIIAYLERQGK